jgi:adenylyl-sulfate kinase
MLEHKATNIRWHAGEVTRAQREALLRQRGCTIWMTGYSASGKSTIAAALERELLQRGHHAYRLDGDNIRHGLSRDLGFSAEDRAENIRRIGEVAALFADAGLITITSFISPYRADRKRARAAARDAFHEIYIHADLDTCERRDPKGLYKKARRGEIAEFTGVSAPYEAPEAAELTVDTDRLSIEESVARIVVYVEKNFVILRPATTGAPA